MSEKTFTQEQPLAWQSTWTPVITEYEQAMLEKQIEQAFEPDEPINGLLKEISSDT